MRPAHSNPSYSDDLLKKLKGIPHTCRFRGHGVYGDIFCQHSDTLGYACIEDWCLSCFDRDYVEQNYSPKAWHNKEK